MGTKGSGGGTPPSSRHAWRQRGSLRSCHTLIRVNTVLLNNNKDASKQTDPCSGEDSMEDTTQDSPEIDLTDLFIREGEAPENDEIIVEVEVDNVEEVGNEEEETFSNDDMEYNVTVECCEIIVAQRTA